MVLGASVWEATIQGLSDRTRSTASAAADRQEPAEEGCPTASAAAVSERGGNPAKAADRRSEWQHGERRIRRRVATIFPLSALTAIADWSAEESGETTLIVHRRSQILPGSSVRNVASNLVWQPNRIREHRWYRQRWRVRWNAIPTYFNPRRGVTPEFHRPPVSGPGYVHAVAARVEGWHQRALRVRRLKDCNANARPGFFFRIDTSVVGSMPAFGT